MLYSEEDLLALSGIQHFAFCPRQWALIHIENQWRENIGTAEGRHLHEKVHSRLSTEARGEVLITRSLPLVSYYLGLSGVADSVEFLRVQNELGGITLPGRPDYWLPYPVEYKRGKPKIDDRDDVQLCAQAMCLEEMLQISIESGSLYYGEVRRRAQVTFNKDLRHRVEELSKDMHQVFSQGKTPMPPKGVRCGLCSLEEVCLPKLARKKTVTKHIASWIYPVGSEDEECESS